MKKSLLIVLLSVIAGNAFAQVKYWVFFEAKPLAEQQMANPDLYLSAKAIQRRAVQEISIHASDMPIHNPYVKGVEDLGAFVLRKSKWLNAVSVFATQQQIEEISKLDFVAEIKPVRKMARQDETINSTTGTTTTPYAYGGSLNQINMLGGKTLHDDGSRGQGMTIAVLDGGFTGANWYQPFDTLWNDGRVIALHDFMMETPMCLSEVAMEPQC
jgi:hypothetical protein